MVPVLWQSHHHLQTLQAIFHMEMWPFLSPEVHRTEKLFKTKRTRASIPPLKTLPWHASKDFQFMYACLCKYTQTWKSRHGSKQPTRVWLLRQSRTECIFTWQNISVIQTPGRRYLRTLRRSSEHVAESSIPNGCVRLATQPSRSLSSTITCGFQFLILHILNQNCTVSTEAMFYWDSAVPLQSLLRQHSLWSE